MERKIPTSKLNQQVIWIPKPGATHLVVSSLKSLPMEGILTAFIVNFTSYSYIGTGGKLLDTLDIRDITITTLLPKSHFSSVTYIIRFLNLKGLNILAICWNKQSRWT